MATQMWLDCQASKMLKEKKSLEAELRKFGWLSHNKVLAMQLSSPSIVLSQSITQCASKKIGCNLSSLCCLCRTMTIAPVLNTDPAT